MKISSYITINGNLISNEKCSITYSGYLFENNSDSVSIVYGFDSDWKETKEQKMIKTENGFSADITLLDYPTINFCFKNSNNEWDNNFETNFSANIESPIYDFIINEGIIDTLIENMLKCDVSEFIESPAIPESTSLIDEPELQISTPITFEVEPKIEETIQIEDSLISSQEEDTLKDTINLLFDDIYDTKEKVEEKSQVENTILNNTYANADDNSNPIQEFDIDSLTFEEPLNQVSNFDMNSLVDEILSPITNAEVFEEDNVNTNITESFIETNDLDLEIFEESFDDSIEDLKNDEKVDNMIDSLITNLSSENAETNLDELYKELTANFSNTESFDDTDITDSNVAENLLEDLLTSQNSSTDINDIFEESIISDTESSLFEENSLPVTPESENLSLIEVNSENKFIVSARSLSKFYVLKKKVKLAFYKIVSLPKYLLGLN